MQGLFELAEVAYTGCNPVVSAVGMHKHFAKQLPSSQWHRLPAWHFG